VKRTICTKIPIPSPSPAFDVRYRLNKFWKAHMYTQRLCNKSSKNWSKWRIYNKEQLIFTRISFPYVHNRIMSSCNGFICCTSCKSRDWYTTAKGTNTTYLPILKNQQFHPLQ
jgi:hypothetical protein